MKKIYLQPAIRVVKIQPHAHVLGYSVNEYTRGGEETVTDDNGW
jgi:hypothetical protein